MDDGALVPLLAPMLAWALVYCRSWQPRPTSWLIAVVSALLALSSTVTLAVEAVESWMDGSPLLGTVFGALFVTALVSAGAAAWHRRRAWQVHVDGLAILPDDEPLAYALPGGVVVSRGMVRALGADQRRALLAHERAHVSLRHHRFVLVVDLASAAQPLLWPLRAAVRYTVERWADEVAAAATGDRVLTARAVATAALAARQSRLSVAALGISAGPVPQRVAALLTPAQPRYRVLALLALLLAAFVLAEAGEAVLDLWQLL
ncbi:M56 family metallopeptidase [Kutzneria buriramensis]|uniref:Zn-dependent protease with chaperone function n=1 Tax=Kutzneria buriramensis TaxID=1045776 RepID=A0A3E0HPW2_9PSEU|nr:M56 family metallopeptidase [Kutzneria buriramensis]REH48602.1 Zn-dependent protease with chaperone function [Kutzneria buriramensis]